MDAVFYAWYFSLHLQGWRLAWQYRACWSTAAVDLIFDSMTYMATIQREQAHREAEHRRRERERTGDPPQTF